MKIGHVIGRVTFGHKLDSYKGGRTAGQRQFGGGV
jgi:hypothetical protein